eukprot:Nk52_evm16s349 gene=Nk52_evmTU16s349
MWSCNIIAQTKRYFSLGIVGSRSTYRIISKSNSNLMLSYYSTQDSTSVGNAANRMEASLYKRIAVGQMRSTDSVEGNLAAVETLISEAKDRDCKMIFLPEAFDYVSGSSQEAVDMSQPLTGERFSRYRSLAKKYGMFVSYGGFHESAFDENDVNPAGEGSKRIFNTHVIVDDKGNIMEEYRKLHLFDVSIKNGATLLESKHTKPGEKYCDPVETPVGNVGMAICYDLRFPELSLAMRRKGADILTFPSAFTEKTGAAHWEVLLRARAIENQSYVVAAAQTGKHNEKRSSYGHAMIVDPWGTVLCQCNSELGIACAVVDMNLLHRLRTEMPMMNHRRNDIF